MLRQTLPAASATTQRRASALSPCRFRPSVVRQTPSRRLHVTQAAEQAEPQVYYGRFGPWTITNEDRAEVIGYRLGISATAIGFLFCGAYGLLPADQDSTRAAMQGLLDPAVVLGAAGLGVSLQLIHIYIGVLKRTLQALWAVGTVASLYLILTQDAPAATFVYEHPVWIWAVGPLFAALTGVAFKEGLCYNKWEAAGLFGALPLLVGGHLLGFVPHNVEQGLLASCCVLLAVFAGRKYTQAFKDDIGDKSIFEMQKLPQEQQQELLRKLNFDD
ncbi:hypothetical protein CHLRE_04g228450v5 [Chlamydomonas reinhardtii]|uniref:Integral membrane protein n=1 Tax=Chlamydomonas reinhardtii TaxID=3055 RepID=A0A2K3DUS2_CHLRE|nr:uncharacterized protein CHLRE_04g228450v5 [Chlamydomonas reinhardtii]PNW84290.1 hypothetical protein CHLRE_04g228450v5 [Chlamydomonas reinhardtii]